LPFNFTSEYAIRKIQEKQAELKYNGTYQLLAYADDMNVMEDTMQKSTTTKTDVSK
jgi:hypothetical protein